MRVRCSVWFDSSIKDHWRRHDCWRGDIQYWQDGKRVKRVRKRFKTKQEAWEWVGKIKAG